MTNSIRSDLTALMMIPGLSGHEDRVRRHLRDALHNMGVDSRSDTLGNLIASFPGDADAPSVMIFAHMDQLGFFVRRIDDDGLIRVERMGGVPERALASQAVLLCVEGGADIPGVIANKAHHATTPDEKYRVLKAPEIAIDTGHGSKRAVMAAGIGIGTPVVYRPQVIALAGDRMAGPSIDDRAGCAVLMDLARGLAGRSGGATVHLVFSVQEEFNLRGAMTAAAALAPDIAIQIDLMLATDTPDMADRGEMTLGGGPGVSHYSFHGRGTLNGVIPHPAARRLIRAAASLAQVPLQHSAQVGVLTDLSYVQQLGCGVICVDVGFPMRYSHSSLEMCDLNDLAALSLLLAAALEIAPGFDLSRDGDAA